ncbi:MAG: ATP-binding protein [Verrucomicrobiales bacterium]|nr:ATP-binding protein [Verrucomicrobiales bacterium]
MSERLTIEIARTAGRLAAFLTASFPQAEGLVAQNIAFLRAQAQIQGPSSTPSPREPLDHLETAGPLSAAELDVLVLAGLSDEHEGYAAVLRSLHPRSEPRAAVGLVAQVLRSGRRADFRAWLEQTPLARRGLVRVTGSGPYFERSLELAEELWPVLHGQNVWPTFLAPPRTEAGDTLGLADWFTSEHAARAARAVRERHGCTIVITGDSEEVAFTRGLALVQATQRTVAGCRLTNALDPDQLRTLLVHALARQSVLVLRIPPPEGAGTFELPPLGDYPDAVVLCLRHGTVALRGARPVLGLPVERLSSEVRRAVWRSALPALAGLSERLAARYPLEPAQAVEIASDVNSVAAAEGRAPTLDDVAHAMRTRSAVSLSSGVQLIRPNADWRQLVLSEEREALLRAAIDRLELQSRVLDDWAFLAHRPGARGVRLLFAGPPGTGKTLSAEVLARTLNVDLLVVDLSRVVSKWIGETEKNLAAVFDAAERAQAVLFFDEADALFGKRTEVSDAHDRYANLETAYLLARLERFEGLAILATNLRQNLDPAFLRRLEFVVEFDEPDRAERQRLWSCHIPSESLLDSDVNLAELAALYPIVGGLIRNAAVAAAFLAAADGTKIGRSHFLRAIRREYEKSGKAFPGVPHGSSRS